MLPAAAAESMKLEIRCDGPMGPQSPIQTCQNQQQHAWTDERQHAMPPSFSFSCAANDGMAKVRHKQARKRPKAAGYLERVPLLPEQRTELSFLNRALRIPSEGHPSASGKKHTRIFRPDAANAIAVHSFKFKLVTTVSMTCAAYLTFLSR